ncbi:MAG: hypothetical protein GXO26_10035 [Crenarchaeota archaeon]|nr:hypothetical protein [Thermoproteota archaeon]
MSINVDVLETAYQLLIADNMNIVEKDCEVRYGDKWRDIINSAKIFIEEYCRDVDKDECINMIIRNYGEEIARSVIERAGDKFESLRPVIRYFNKNAHVPISEEELNCILKLCNIDLDLNNLVKIGLIMHVDEYRVIVPHYLSLYDECQIPVEDRIEYVISEPAKAAALESLIENVEPIFEMFEKLYGVNPSDPSLYNIDALVIYCDPVNRPIIHPCVDMHELRNLFHELKQIRARRLFRMIEPGMGHVKYSKKIGALISYIMLGPGEHGIIMFMPWIVPSRRLERFHSSSARIIVTSVPFRREFAEYFHNYLEDSRTFKNTAFLFVQEGIGYLVAPSKKSRTLDSLLDLIYRSGIEITEF